MMLRRDRLFAAMTGLFCALSPVAMAEPLSFYGTPGLVDLPNAYMLQDGEIALTAAEFGDTRRGTFSFQITPRLLGSFRYAQIRNFDLGGNRDRFDRSFDLVYGVATEGTLRPAVAIGLRDFGGTGVYSSEFIVASKRVGDVTVTGGLGWGRLAGRNSFGSPLGRISDRFRERRVAGEGGIATTGQLDFGNWFAGDVAAFGGLSWQVNDRLTLTAEYSPDLYLAETARDAISIESPLNFGLNYQFENGVNLGAYSLYGAEFGIALSYAFDPANPPLPGGTGTAPPPLLPRAQVAAASWNNSDSARPRRNVLRRRLSQEGLTLENLIDNGDSVEIRIVNSRYIPVAQAVGRAARIMANTLPPRVDSFAITFLAGGLPLSTTRLDRSDLEELEFALDGAWQSLSRAEMANAQPNARAGELPSLYPGRGFDIGYFITPSLFDPDSPLRVEYGGKLDVFYSPQPGLLLSGQVRVPVGGNIDDATRRSNSRIQRVRSDSVLYYVESDVELSHLTGEYRFRPGADLFGRVTAGYLERMYGGVSAELLWYPVNSRRAYGIEVNYVRQRDFDVAFGFQDYDVVTGHASGYFDLGNGFVAQVDMGRYLAGDWGASFGLDREFENGVRVGGFFTLTDVPFADFGEGSFDKGLRLEIPLSWLSGKPSQERIGTVIRPVLRDGGQRVDVQSRLYPIVRGSSGPELTDSWGRFWR